MGKISVTIHRKAYDYRNGILGKNILELNEKISVNLQKYFNSVVEGLEGCVNEYMK